MMESRLIDFHCHLDEFQNAEEVVARAKEQGVHRLLSNSVDLSSCQKNIALGKQYAEIIPLIGFHPGNLLQKTPAEIQETMQFIQKNASKTVGIGETGLDFLQAKTESQIQLQHTIFGELIELAKFEDKTIVVHSRGARDQVLAQLAGAKIEKVILHWFYGNQSQVKLALEKNWKISLGPSILDQKNLHAMIEKLPLQNICLETDSPVPFNGSPSEPSWIRQVAEKICEIKGIPLNELEDSCLAIFKDLF